MVSDSAASGSGFDACRARNGAEGRFKLQIKRL